MKTKSITFLFMVSLLFSCSDQDSKNGLNEIKRLEQEMQKFHSLGGATAGQM